MLSHAHDITIYSITAYTVNLATLSYALCRVDAQGQGRKCEARLAALQSHIARRTRRSHTKPPSPTLRPSAGSAAASPAGACKRAPSGSGSAFTVPLAWGSSPVGAVAGAATRCSTQQGDQAALALPGACREEAAGPKSNSMADEQMDDCSAARQRDQRAGHRSASTPAGTMAAEPEHGITERALGSSLRLQGAGKLQAPASAPHMHPRGMSQQARRLGSARLAARRRLCMSVEMRLPAPPWGAATSPQAASAAPSAVVHAQPACLGQAERTDRPGQASGGASGGEAAGLHPAGGPAGELPAPEAPAGRGGLRRQLETPGSECVSQKGQGAVAHVVDPAAVARPDPSPSTPLRSAGRGSEPGAAPCAALVPVTCAAPEPVSPVVVRAEHLGPAPSQTPSSVPGACDQVQDIGPSRRVTGSDRQGWGGLWAGEESEDTRGASLHVTHADMAGSAPGAALGAVPELCIGGAPDVPAGTTGALAVGVRPPLCTGFPSSGRQKDAVPDPGPAHARAHAVSILPGGPPDGHAPTFAVVPLGSPAASHGRPLQPLPTDPCSPVQALDHQHRAERNPCASPTLPPTAGSSSQPTHVAGGGTPRAQANPDSGTRKAALRSHRGASGGDGQGAAKPGSGLGSELAALRSQVVMAQFVAAAAEAELAGVQRMRDHLAERVAALTAQRMRCACPLLPTTTQHVSPVWHNI